MATACQSEIKEMPQTSDDVNAATLSSTVAALSSTAVAVSSTAAPLSSTSLQDLPIEMLDDILMKVVVKKVMDRKLAKSAWIDYASRVIKPLRTVWSQWDHSLTTNWFEIVLCRKLNNCKDPTTITVELITTNECDTYFLGFGRLNNQIYLIDAYPPDTDSDDSVLHIFEGRDTARHINEIILPSVKGVGGMATCKRSNSIYVWESGPTAWPSCPAVWHLVPDGDGGFEVLHWPNYAPSGDFLDCSTISKTAVDNLSVLEGGNVVASRHVLYEDSHGDNIVSVHKPDGLVIRNLRLSHGVDLSNVAMKSNGNFVYGQIIEDNSACIIREIDQDGKEIRKFHWIHYCSKTCYSKQMFLDSCDRVIFHDGCNDLLFLDCELNFLGEAESIVEYECSEGFQAEFDKETNEMIVMYWVGEVFFLKLTVEHK